jgi:hypothetical protein
MERCGGSHRMNWVRISAGRDLVEILIGVCTFGIHSNPALSNQRSNCRGNQGTCVSLREDVWDQIAKEKIYKILSCQRMIAGWMSQLVTRDNQNVYCWPHAARQRRARSVESKSIGPHCGGPSNAAQGMSYIARIAARVWQADRRSACAMIRDQVGGSQTQPHCVLPCCTR